jgi:hypothetical protein
MRFLLLSFLSLFAGLSFAQARDEAQLKNEPVEKLVPVGQLVGTVEDLSEGRMKLRVTYRHLEPNREAQANYLRERQQLLARQQAALLNPNPAQRYQDLLGVVQDALRLQGQPQAFFNVREQHQDLDVTLPEDVKVRVPAPPVAFDDEGRARRYTAEELKQLKGTEGLPGYPSDLDSLKQGQRVLVVLARKLRFKPGGKELDKEQPPDEKPVATILLIVAEP